MKINNLKSDVRKENIMSNIFNNILQEIFQLFSANKDPGYTIITLYQQFKNTIEWIDYFSVLSQLINTKKIHIEEDGYISWLWNPNLINKIQSENLFLD